MHRASPALTVALLLFVAGCFGGLQAPEHEYSESEVVSTVTDMNASDARRLLNTHWRTLGNTTSYRGRYVSEDGDERYRRTVVVDRDADRYLERKVDGGDESALFLNETARYTRYRGPDDDYQYEVRPSQRFADGRIFFRGVPLPDETVLVRYDFEYVGRTDGGFVFEADGLVDPESVEYGHFYWNMQDATSASARLLVDERGFVRSFTSNVTLQEQSGVVERTSTQSFRMRIWTVNGASAEKPDWVSRAEAAAS